MEGLILTTGGQSVEIDPPASDFVFPQRLRTDTAYDVIVTQYPQNASGMQYCTVVGGSGRIGNGDVSGIHVNCSDAATLSVNVQAGLKGTGLVLVNRGSDPLTINGEITDATAFAFRTPVPATDPVYDITVGTQPVNPHQTCSVTDGAGTYSGAFPGVIATPSVSRVTNRYAIRLNVAGLQEGHTLTVSSAFGTYPAENGLENYPATTAGSETLAITENGLADPFPTKIRSGDTYSLAIDTPATGHTCSIGLPTGTVTSYDVTVPVNCSPNSYAITGSVSGYEGSTPLRIRITANGSSEIIQYSSGSTFTSTAYPYGSSFEMEIISNPENKWQTCSFVDEGDSNGTIVSSGKLDAMGQAWNDRLTDASIHSANPVSGIEIECVTNQFTVGGTITGYDAGSYTEELKLQNGAETITINPGASSFVFSTPVESGDSYSVTVVQPPVLDDGEDGQALNCAVSGGNGVMGGAGVTGIAISCSTDRTIRVTVSGFGVAPDGNFVLDAGAGGPAVPVTANGDYYLPVTSGASYSLNTPSPPDQTCTWSNPSLTHGTVSTNVALELDCSPIVVSTSVGDNDSTLPYDVGVGPITITFNKDMSSSIAANAGSTDCEDQGIQISLVQTSGSTEVPVDNSFTSCVPTSVSVSGNVVTVNPDVDHMWYEGTYRIFIRNAAVSDTYGSGMKYAAGGYLSSQGFNTGKLVRWYRDGSLIDSSRSKVNLSPGTLQAGPGVDGDASGSLQFAGGTYLTGPATGLPQGNESRTVCHWVNLGRLPVQDGNAHFISYGQGQPNQAFGMGVRRTAGGVEYRFFGGLDRDSYIHQRFHLNTWTHLCVGYDGPAERLYFYMNGVQVGVADRSEEPLNTVQDNFYLSGWVEGGGGGLVGLLDDVRVYSALLPSSQIRYLAT